MGSLTVQQAVSLDGYAADAAGDVAFAGSGEDWAAIDRVTLPWLETVDRVLLGAETYRLFVAFWPTDASEGSLVGQRLNAMPKSVFSRTLDAAPWGDLEPATLERGDAVARVRELRRTEDLVLWGSLTLMADLLAGGVVDVVELRVMPVVLGAGRPLFARPWTGRLVGSRSYGDIVVNRYAPAW